MCVGKEESNLVRKKERDKGGMKFGRKEEKMEKRGGRKGKNRRGKKEGEERYGREGTKDREEKTKRKIREKKEKER